VGSASIGSTVRVFAVEPDRVQLSWGRLPVGAVRLTGAGPDIAVHSDGGPGAVDIGPLVANTDYTVAVRHGATRAAIDQVRFRTLSPPPGAELGRLATISDLHLGLHTFGLFDTLRPSEEDGDIGRRCGTAAIDAAAAWGATRLIAKGDMVNRASREEWDVVADLVAHAAASGLDTDLIAGNHEGTPAREVDHHVAMAHHHLGPADAARALDVPGLRVVLLDTTRPDRHRGRLDHATEVIGDLCGGRRVLVVQHHFPQPLPVPHFWPPTVGWSESRRFLDALDRAAPGALLTAGHSHRHRRRMHRSITITEVGSARDYPGTWAGYVVHEGGIRQVVRRIAEPACIAWTHYTRRAALGAWGQWSPGRVGDPCFTHGWPRGEARRPATGRAGPARPDR
jgi:Icc protein